MTAINSTDRSRLRTSSMQTLDPTLVIVPTETVATAVVDAVPTIYPIGSLSVYDTSSGWSNVEPGHFFRITDRDQDDLLIFWGVVRLTPTSSVLYIDGKSQGDPGLANAIHSALGDNTYDITVYRIKPLWTMLSRIANGVFFKKFDVAYDGSGSNPNPVVNIGKHQIIKVVSSGDEGTVQLDASDSFTWSTKTISTYTWTLPAEATITSGTINDSSLTITLPQGFYEISCTVVDSGSATFTGTRGFWIIGPDYEALSDTVSIDITGDETDREGRELSITLYGENVGEDTILPGTMLAFRDFPLYDGQQLETEHLQDYFVGFVTDREEVYESGISGEKSVSFVAKSPYKIMQAIPQVSQVINEVAAPTSWEEVSRGLGDVNFAIWYILKHHTTYMEMFDYSPLDDTLPPRKRAWGLNGNTIAAQLQEIAGSTLGNVGSSTNGTLYVRRDPSVENNTFRDALDNNITLTESDFVENFVINRAFFNQVAYIRAYALSMQSTNETIAVASIAPGTQQGQAINSSQYESILMVPNSGQSDINIISGMLYAKENSPISSVSTVLPRNFDVFDPAQMIWSQVDVSASASPINRRFLSRVVPLTVSRAWEQTDATTWVKNLSVEFEIETFGQPGVTLPVNAGDGLQFPAFPPFDIPFASFPSVTFDEVTDAGEGNNEASSGTRGFFVVTADNGQAFYTNNGNTTSPSWVELFVYDYTVDTEQLESAVINDIAWDYDSNYFGSGNISDNMGLYIVRADGANYVRLYHRPDLRSEEDMDQLSFDFGAISSNYNMTIGVTTNRINPNLISYAWLDGQQVYGVWANSGTGSTFTDYPVGEEAEGDLIIDATENLPIAIDSYDTTVVTSGVHNTNSPLPFSLYWRDDVTTTWAEIANKPGTGTRKPAAIIAVASDTKMYASYLDSETNDYAKVIAQEAFDAFIEEPVSIVSLTRVTDPVWAVIPPDIESPKEYAVYYEDDGFISPTGGIGIRSDQPDVELQFDFTWGSGVSSTTSRYSFRFNARVHDGTRTSVSQNIDCVVDVTPTITLLGTSETYTLDTFRRGIIPTFNGGVAASGEVYIVGEDVDINGCSGARIELLIEHVDGGGDTATMTVEITSISLSVFGTDPADELEKVYRIDNYKESSATWTDITPPNDEIPTVFSGIDINTGNSSQVNILNSNWYQSTSNGNSWDLIESSTNKKAMFSKGNTYVAGGSNYMVLSPDGNGFFDKSGDILSLASDDPIIIRRILGL